MAQRELNTAGKIATCSRLKFKQCFINGWECAGGCFEVFTRLHLIVMGPYGVALEPSQIILIASSICDSIFQRQRIVWKVYEKCANFEVKKEKCKKF